MPTIECSKKDLEKLVGKRFALREQLEEALEFAKSGVDKVEGDKLSIEVSDTNRPDLLSAEGLAREIRSHFTKDKGVPKYKLAPSGVSVIVDKNVAAVRPCIAAAIVKNIKVTEDFLVQMIQLQEKVCLTFGRKRKEASIGLYDWRKLKAPMRYKAFAPRAIKFVPLEYKVEMDLEEILAEHPKGKEYAHLLKGAKEYPVFLDDNGVVASMPPIINSQLTGKVDEKTKELLVEVTGYKQETVDTALAVMVSALIERGFKAFSVKVKYPSKAIVTPNFSPKKIEVNIDYAKRLSGLDIENKKMVSLLKDARYDAKLSGKKIIVSYPAYRQDILHAADVIEDLCISFGYNRIVPQKVELAVVGSELAETKSLELAREACVGLGLQEVLTFTMTAREKQQNQMLLPEQEFVELSNPVSLNWQVFRKSLIPELLEFLSKNKDVSYPQKIFEVGKTLEVDKSKPTGVKEPLKLCIAIASKETNFTDIKSHLEAACKALGISFETVSGSHPSFENGKVALVKMQNKKGIVGEVNKAVLQKFGLEVPVTVAEIEL